METKDCDLNVLNDILDNIDDQAYIDDEDESAVEDVNRVDKKKPTVVRSYSDSGTNRGTGRPKPGSREDDNLRKLEQERRRLEMENEEIKRQVEELKRQELLMEQAARKGDYMGNSIKDQEDDPDRRLKRRSLDLETESHHQDDERGVGSDLDAEPVTDDDLNEDIISESSHSNKDNADRGHSPEEGNSRKPDSKENGRGWRRLRDASSVLSSHGKRHHGHGSRSSHSKRKRGGSAESPRRKRHSPSHKHGHTRHRSPSREHSSKLQYIFRDAKFFLIKSSNHENVALAQAKGVWSSPPPNEMRINQAFRSHSNVILIFSVKESGKFQGFARVASESDRNHPLIRWVLPVGISARMLSGVFTLDWINRNELEFDRTLHIRNTFNEGCAVKIGRDGQEIDPVSGEEVCRLFPRDRHIDLNAIAMKSKQTLKLNGIAAGEARAPSPRAAPPPYYRQERHNRLDKLQDRHGRDSKWSGRYNHRNRSPVRRPMSGRYGHHSVRDGHQHLDPIDEFRGFHHKMGLPPPMPPPGFMPPPVYGHMHPPPPPPPFMFDRLSRGQPSRHMMDKRSGRHMEDEFAYRNSRDGRSHPYDRQPRDRR